MGQQHPEGVRLRRADLRRQLLRRLLVRKAVGIVDPRQEDAVPVPGQGDVLVGQHRDPGVPQLPLQLPDVPEGPLVVASDEVRGGDLRQRPAQGHRVASGRPAIPVLKVPRQENIVRSMGADLGNQVLVLLAEQSAVEVRELHDDAAVEALRQPGGGEGEALRLQGVVAPPEESGT